MKKADFEIRWKPDDICPCGCGRSYGDCCYVADYLLPRSPMYKITTPGDKTGFSNPKCYLSFSNDCSKKISREHYVSGSLFEKNIMVSVSGLPWQKDKPEKSVALSSLTSKILCTRHNSALSEVDVWGVRAIKSINEAIHHATKRSVSRKEKRYLVHGELLELWALKAMFGMYHAKASASKGIPLAGSHFIDQSIANTAFFASGVPDQLGAYYLHKTILK